MKIRYDSELKVYWVWKYGQFLYAYDEGTFAPEYFTKNSLPRVAFWSNTEEMHAHYRTLPLIKRV